jgi:hypothetical protein
VSTTTTVTKSRIRRLLVAGDPTMTNAYVGINRGPDARWLYALGYFEGARELATNMLAPGSMADVVVYSALFLLRHGVELSLKQLAAYQDDISPMVAPPAKKDRSHSLHGIWAGLTKDGEEIENGGVRSLVAHFENECRFHDLEYGPILSVPEMDYLVEDIDRLDPLGQTFRYPESTKGEAHLAGVETIYIPELAQLIEEMRATFRTWLDEIRDDAAWYRSERRRTEADAADTGKTGK